jgi:hypothetical protein
LAPSTAPVLALRAPLLPLSMAGSTHGRRIAGIPDQLLERENEELSAVVGKCQAAVVSGMISAPQARSGAPGIPVLNPIRSGTSCTWIRFISPIDTGSRLSQPPASAGNLTIRLRWCRPTNASKTPRNDRVESHSPLKNSPPVSCCSCFRQTFEGTRTVFSRKPRPPAWLPPLRRQQVDCGTTGPPRSAMAVSLSR